MHTHSKVRTVIATAQAHCVQHGLRLTPQRAEVLGIIARAKKPLTAYTVLEKLKKNQPKAQPPIVYRAVEFLQEHGFIHRIESLNAYTACAADHLHTGSQFMICGGCGAALEAHVCEVPVALKKLADGAAFKITRWQTELHGVCAECAA